MSYINILNNGGDCIVYGEIKSTAKDVIYVHNVPTIVIPEFQKFQWDGRSLIIETDCDGMRNKIYDVLEQKYALKIEDSNNEYLEYHKKKELGIAIVKDDEHYVQAMQLYKEAVEWYAREIDAIGKLDEKMLINIIKSWYNYG